MTVPLYAHMSTEIFCMHCRDIELKGQVKNEWLIINTELESSLDLFYCNIMLFSRSSLENHNKPQSG
jgi:hypothetical protein